MTAREFPLRAISHLGLENVESPERAAGRDGSVVVVLPSSDRGGDGGSPLPCLVLHATCSTCWTGLRIWPRRRPVGPAYCATCQPDAPPGLGHRQGPHGDGCAQEIPRITFSRFCCREKARREGKGRNSQKRERLRLRLRRWRRWRRWRRRL